MKTQKNKLYACPKCGRFELYHRLVICTDCNFGPLVEVRAYGDSTVRENTVIAGVGHCQVIYSTEAIQDIHAIGADLRSHTPPPPTSEEIEFWKLLHVRRYLFGRIRTPEPTEEEIEGWKDAYEKLKKLDFEAVKKKYKVVFFRDEYCDEPYVEFDIYGQQIYPSDI